jgi:hypothetical protein
LVSVSGEEKLFKDGHLVGAGGAGFDFVFLGVASASKSSLSSSESRLEKEGIRFFKKTYFTPSVG